MRDTVTGLLLALVFLAGLFALARYLPHQELQVTPARIAAGIEPGFSGVRQIGPWILACGPEQKKAVPLPFSLSPGRSNAPVVADQEVGRCRTFIAFRRKADPKQVVLMVSFRLVGRAQRLVALVRMPPTAKKGDVFSIRLGKRILNLPISTCEKGGCLAAGALLPKQEAMLYSQSVVELLLPPGADGKRRAVQVFFGGLRLAIGAMRRAQVGD